MMLEDERMLEEKKLFYQRRLRGQLVDAVSLALEAAENKDSLLAQGARIAFNHAKKTAEDINDEELKMLAERTGVFLASIIGE